MKGLILLSGGLDSSTCLAKFSNYISHCVYLDYGSTQANMEKKASKAIAKHYEKEWLKLDLRDVFKDFKSALLGTEKINLGSYDKLEESNAKVPFRNGIFASILVGLAESLKIPTIFIGVHAGDHRMYSDCTPQFWGSFNNLLIAYARGSEPIEVATPFVGLTKAEIAAIAEYEKLPINLTYSCYQGGETHCGVCPTCLERRDALGLFDTTIYLN